MHLARALRLLPALLLAVSLSSTLHAQAAKSITVLVYDGKTGEAITPDNYVVRVDHHDTNHNEWLSLHDDGPATVSVPDNSSFFSIQVTYHRSMDFYVNCDAGMEKNTSTLHWYPVADILSKGVAAQNECYKGKFAQVTHKDPKPGEFILFVRALNAREQFRDN